MEVTVRLRSRVGLHACPRCDHEILGSAREALSPVPDGLRMTFATPVRLAGVLVDGSAPRAGAVTLRTPSGESCSPEPGDWGLGGEDAASDAARRSSPSPVRPGPSASRYTSTARSTPCSTSPDENGSTTSRSRTAARASTRSTATAFSTRPQNRRWRSARSRSPVRPSRQPPHADRPRDARRRHARPRDRVDPPAAVLRGT